MSSSKDVFVSAPNGWHKKMIGGADSVGQAMILARRMGYRVEKNTDPKYEENAGEITIFARPIPGLANHTSADAQ